MTQTIRYQAIAGHKGHEWMTPTRNFRSKERALTAIRKLKKMFGNATLLTYNKVNYGYELLESQDM
jgi:hypothetical protein